jgi:hypothetical protein
MKAQTSHIETCRRAWHEHFDSCPECHFSTVTQGEHLTCEKGRFLWGEYAASITANRDCEHLTGTEATCTTTNDKG